MAEDTTNKKEKRSFGEAASDVIGNMVDTMAAGGRASNILGSAFAAGLNTEGFQAKKAKLASMYAAEQRAAESHKKSMEHADLQAQRAQNQEQRAQNQERRAQEGFELDKQSHKLRLEQQQKEMAEWDKNAELRDAQREANLAIIKQNKQNAEMTTVRNNVEQKVMNNPLLQNMNEAEKKQVMNSPAVRDVMTWEYTARNLLNARKGGQEGSEAWERFEDTIRAAGGELSQDDKGDWMLTLGGYTIPVNEQSGTFVDNVVNQALQQELMIQESISYNATRGNALGKIHADRVNELIPYTGGSATVASKQIQETISTLPFNQRIIMSLNRTLSDYFDKAVTDNEKMAEIEQAIAEDASGMSMLSRLGFTYNAGSERPDDATIIDIKTKKMYSLPEFMQYLKDHDEGSKILDNQAKTIKANFEAAQKAALAKSLADSGGETMDEGSVNISNAFRSEYGVEYGKLPDEEQGKLVRAMKEWNFTRANILQRHKVKDEKDLPMEALQTLEDAWGLLLDTADMNKKSFYSPVNSLIQKKQIEKLQDEINNAEQNFEKTWKPKPEEIKLYDDPNNKEDAFEYAHKYLTRKPEATSEKKKANAEKKKQDDKKRYVERVKRDNEKEISRIKAILNLRGE